MVPRPLYPTSVVTAFKGGVGKTAVAVAQAELLAHQGLRVLLVITDKQQDARYRLDRDGKSYVVRGRGSVRTIMLEGSEVAALLYRTGAAGVGLKRAPDVVVVDTPPSLDPSSLPGVTLVVPVDGSPGTYRNVVQLMSGVDPSATCALLGMSSAASQMSAIKTEDWLEIVQRIEKQVPDVSFIFSEQVLRFSNEIAEAHAFGQSVWELPRPARSKTRTFLDGVSAVTRDFVDRELGTEAWCGDPPAPSSPPFIPGYDEA